MFHGILIVFGLFVFAEPAAAQTGSRTSLDPVIARHAAANGVPVSLVHRVIVRESRYNSRIVGRGGAMGLMQIKYATARGIGYSGSAAGLLDPETNLTYGVRYLAGAYRAAGGNHDRAVHYYARGYYHQAKRQGFAVASALPFEPQATRPHRTERRATRARRIEQRTARAHRAERPTARHRRAATSPSLADQLKRFFSGQR